MVSLIERISQLACRFSYCFEYQKAISCVERFHIICLFQFGIEMFGGVPRTFNTQFRCYSVVMFPGNEREDVERGGKSKIQS